MIVQRYHKSAVVHALMGSSLDIEKCWRSGTFHERVDGPYGERPETGELAERHLEVEEGNSGEQQHGEVGDEERTLSNTKHSTWWSEGRRRYVGEQPILNMVRLGWGMNLVEHQTLNMMKWGTPKTEQQPFDKGKYGMNMATRQTSNTQHDEVRS